MLCIALLIEVSNTENVENIDILVEEGGDSFTKQTTLLPKINIYFETAMVLLQKKGLKKVKEKVTKER